jgi:prepilin-type N-terminal cleavage/methylation domain-containing protein
MLKRIRGSYGFTMVELMIAMVIASIVAAAIVMAFDSQEKSQVNQHLVVEMQQEARAALYLMQKDIRMAGYDETWEDGNSDGIDDNRPSDGLDNDCDGVIDAPADADEGNDITGIVQAGPHLIQIRLDEDGDGDFLRCQRTDHLRLGERIHYGNDRRRRFGRHRGYGTAQGRSNRRQPGKTRRFDPDSGFRLCI